MTRKIRIADVLDQVDKKALRQLADTLLERGHTPDEVIEDIVALIDASVDWTVIGSAAGPVGAAVGAGVELIDGPLATFIARSIVHGAARRRKRAA